MYWSAHYILKDKTPVICRDFMQWAVWMGKNHNARIVKKTTAAGVEVSTVFLGLDHGYEDGRPVLFATMIFGGKHDQECWRCCTWEEAEEQHGRVTREVIGLKVVRTNG